MNEDDLVGSALASLGDPQSGAFIREELIDKLENVKAFWVEGVKSFYLTVARKCEGKEVALSTIAEGVGGIVAFAKGANLGRYGAETRSLMDEYRKGRETGDFTPMGEYLLGDGGDP